MRRPLLCPLCKSQGRIWSLGYYARNLSRLNVGNTLRIQVRRFRCNACGKTISVLPSFAQPYRLVQNKTIERFFKGYTRSIDVIWWAGLLKRYQKRFAKWIPELVSVLGQSLSRSPPFAAVSEWLSVIQLKYGPLQSCTKRIVTRFRITLFGRYRCHQAGDSSLN